MAAAPGTADSLDPDSSAVTLDALVERAMHEHRAGRLAGAQQAYQQVLARAPDHPDALHLLGVLEAQCGRAERAAALIAQAIAARPTEAMFHNNLGNVSVELGRDAIAEAHYLRAIELDPGRLDALNNLGVLLGRRGRPEAAEQLLRRVIELAPTFFEARQNLARLYLDSMPASGSPPAHGAEAGAAAADGASDPFAKAAAVYRAWLDVEPGNPVADFQLRALTGDAVPAVAPERYVTGLFDQFARSFDANLARLQYRAPELIAAAVARRRGPPARRFDIVDAGCGTGLCGVQLAPWARQLLGVDLSQGMLRKALARGLYDELFQGEMVAFLAGRPARCDLLVSADTLIYVGALEPFAAAARCALRDGGLLVFTVEAHSAEDAAGYRLQQHGRYSHSPGYIDAVLRGAGLAPFETEAVVLRQEAGRPARGWLVCAQAAGAPAS